MLDRDRIPGELCAILEEQLGNRLDDINFPPPVFDTLRGEMVEIDLDKKVLVNRFPVLSEYLNPYGTLQGGIIAAVIDNTIGPLSMLVAPPSYTRHLELKYTKAISPEIGFVYVKAKFMGSKKRLLYFQASVESQQGDKFATANSTHWVIE
ncbi:MAG: PaaI family thioesterase [Sedimenticola sp.]|nr:MAG: PaaI family thioesterase [Sedimenticola sp.]